MITLADRQVLAAAREIKARTRKAAKQARPVNVKADRGRVRDPAFLAFLRRQPCVIGGDCEGPIQACHIRYGLPGEAPTGLQRKPSDTRCTSMCAKHHALQHAGNERQFWASRGLDPFAIAGRLYVEFLAGSSLARPKANTMDNLK